MLRLARALAGLRPCSALPRRRRRCAARRNAARVAVRRRCGPGGVTATRWSGYAASVATFRRGGAGDRLLQRPARRRRGGSPRCWPRWTAACASHSRWRCRPVRWRVGCAGGGRHRAAPGRATPAHHARCARRTAIPQGRRAAAAARFITSAPPTCSRASCRSALADKLVLVGSSAAGDLRYRASAASGGCNVSAYQQHRACSMAAGRPAEIVAQLGAQLLVWQRFFRRCYAAPAMARHRHRLARSPDDARPVAVSRTRLAYRSPQRCCSPLVCAGIGGGAQLARRRAPSSSWQCSAPRAAERRRCRWRWSPRRLRHADREPC